MTGRQTAGGRAFACHHFTTRCRRKGVRQRQLSQLCPAMHSVNPLSATGQLSPPCFLALPTIIASAIHSFIRAPLPGSIISSSVSPPFSQLDALFVLDALLARRLLWWPFVATPVFTHLHLHLHFASIISMPRLMLRALWHKRQQQKQRQRRVETAAQKALPTLRRI